MTDNTQKEKPEIEEKKSNPVVKFFTDVVLKPADKIFNGILKTVENAGMTNQIQYPFYLTQDTLWWGITHNLFDFEIYGSENVPPEGKAAVVCSNHQSLFDPIIFCVTFAHYSRRRIHVMGKEEMFAVPFISSYIRWCYAFPVKRGEHDVEAYNKAIDFLRQGELVGMYPEGTTNYGGFDFLEPKSGAARMAIDAKVPILPVGISGTDRFLPRSQKFPNLNVKLTVKIGEPIIIHEKFFEKNDATHEDLIVIMNHVMEKIKGLLVY